MPAILVVDDSAVARALGARRLRELGFDVTAVASAAEAQSVDPRRFGAALLDLELEDGLGTDLARALRAVEPGLPIAFLTASTERQALGDAEALGPVFSKITGVDEAISWVHGAARGSIGDGAGGG